MTSPRRASGFTLIELVVVMGLLAFFLLFLLTILRNSLRLWHTGEERLELEDRGALAVELATDDLTRMRGLFTKTYSTGRKSRAQALRGSRIGPSQAGRLRVDWVAFDKTKPAPVEAALHDAERFEWYQRLRFVADLDPIESDRLLRADLRKRIAEERGVQDPGELDTLVSKEMNNLPVRPPGEIALRVIPSTLGDGAYLELHRSVHLLGENVQQRWVDDGELPALGEPLLSNLLYVQFLFRSQFTRSLTVRSSMSTTHAPEWCWDSARAGTFPEKHPVLRFTLDLDQHSEFDPLDDVMPTAVRLLVVVDASADRAYTAQLADDLNERGKDIRVEFPDRLVLPEEGQPGYVKIGTEWIEFASLSGDKLTGVKRGVRFTRPRKHTRGARVHSGRTMIKRLELATSREYWNG